MRRDAEGRLSETEPSVTDRKIPRYRRFHYPGVLKRDTRFHRRERKQSGQTLAQISRQFPTTNSRRSARIKQVPAPAVALSIRS